MIDPTQLAAWRKLCEEASFSPWTCRGHEEFDVRSLVYSIDGPNEPVILADGCCTEPDAAFIAAARTALPQLLDEVEALQAELAAEYRHNHTLDESHSGLVVRVKELEAEVARLRKENP